MKRRTFLKTLGLTAAIPWTARVCHGAAASSSGTEPRTLRVLSCNVRVDVPADSRSGNGWAHRRDFCAEVILSRKPDLIGLQETQQTHFDFLSERFGQFDRFALYNPGTPPLPLNAIFFSRDRFEQLSAGGFWISETPHVAGSRSWDTANPRFVNWVDLRERATGKALRFWNTHLDHVGHLAREKGAELIVDAGKPFSSDLPQILTGDMNAGSDHPAIKRLVEGGWRDTYGAIHGPEDPGFTAHAFRGVNAPSKRPDGSTKRKIDWIFCRGPMEPLAATIIRDNKEGRYPSDHFFISADVRF